MNDKSQLDHLLVDHLHRRADEATPLPQLESIVASDRTARVTPIDRSRASGRGRLLVAAAALAALGVGALAIVGTGGDRPVAPADGPELPAPVQPSVATIGNYIPGGTLVAGLDMLIEEARFDSEETSYARIVGSPDPASTTPSEQRVVVTSVWRSRSIVTGPIPATPTQTPATLDGLDIVVGTDAAGDHHLVEFTRPDGDQVRIEGTAISLPAFLDVIDDLVYADARSWASLVNAMSAPTGTEVPATLPVASESPDPAVEAAQPLPADEVAGTTPPFVTDESGITVPADTALAEEAAVGTLPQPADTGTDIPSDTQSPTEIGSLPVLQIAELTMLVVDQPSDWEITSQIVGEVNQSVWSSESADAEVTVTVSPNGAPVVTYAQDSFPVETVVEPRGLVFVDGDPATIGVTVRSDRDGRQHAVGLTAFEDGSTSPFRFSISFVRMSIDEVTDFLSIARGIDQGEWQQIADASG